MLIGWSPNYAQNIVHYNMTASTCLALHDRLNRNHMIGSSMKVYVHQPILGEV